MKINFISKPLMKRLERYLKLESFFGVEVESTSSPCSRLYGTHTNGELVCVLALNPTLWIKSLDQYQ